MPGHTMKKKGKSKMNMGGMMSAEEIWTNT
jgi:hypothetical protein